MTTDASTEPREKRLFGRLPHVAARGLLCLAAVDPAGELPGHLIDPTDGPWLAGAAERTGLAALLWGRLTQEQRRPMAATVQDRLAALQLAYGVTHEAARRQLGECLRRFAEGRIPVILLKGLALAETLYAEPGTRLLADLDLLVRDADLPQARALLAKDGIVHGSARADHLHGAPIGMADGALPVELHVASQHVAWWPQSGTGDPLERAREIGVGDTRVLTLDPVDTYLHVACHGLRHAVRYWPRMAADLARLARSELWTPDCWSAVLEAADRARRRRAILVAASLANGGALPAELRRCVPTPEADDADRRARIGWRLSLDSADRRSGVWVRAWTLDQARDRAHELKRELLPSLGRVADQCGGSPSLAVVAYPASVAFGVVRVLALGVGWGVRLWRYR